MASVSPFGIGPGDLPGTYFRNEDTPPANPDPNKPADKPAEQPNADPNKPADKPADQNNQENAWRRKAEDAQKELKKYQDAEEARKQAEMTETEREKARADKAEADAKDASAKLLKLQIATEAGVPVDALDLLTATDEDGLRAQAAAVVKLAGGTETTPKKAGSNTNPAGGQQPSIDEQITAAQKAGNNQEAIRLKRQKAFGQ